MSGTVQSAVSQEVVVREVRVLFLIMVKEMGTEWLSDWPKNSQTVDSSIRI